MPRRHRLSPWKRRLLRCGICRSRCMRLARLSRSPAFSSSRRCKEKSCACTSRTAPRCRQGDPLFDIDARSFEVALKRAQANLAMARSTADNASEQAERYTTLINRGVASKEQFSQYLSTAESQKSVLDARQADVDEAQLSLGWAQVRAPISGRAGSALLKPGNIVNANTDVLTVINQMEPIYVAFSLHEGALD